VRPALRAASGFERLPPKRNHSGRLAGHAVEASTGVTAISKLAVASSKTSFSSNFLFCVAASSPFNTRSDTSVARSRRFLT
jgi:hypothetical protein